METEKVSVGSLIKRIDGPAQFSFYRNGVLYYRVVVQMDEIVGDPNHKDKVAFSFPVYTSDLDWATVNASEKPIILMRYIRRALDDGTFVRTK